MEILFVPDNKPLG